jgi:dTDP-4-dehydrorhamnose 3,5-epimerase
MKATRTEIPDVVVIEPALFEDERGAFFESFNHRDFRNATGSDTAFLQDNHSISAKNVVRGLHYQIRQAQGKLVRVAAGEIFDVVVDLRKHSPTFGKWIGTVMSAQNRLQIWIPAGFAHGFAALSDHTEVLYKTTDYYAPEHERTIRWNDATLGIEWPMTGAPIISVKDQNGVEFGAAEYFD